MLFSLSHTLSLSGQRRGLRRGWADVFSWPDSVGRPQRWVGVDWVCSATAHGTADNITGLTIALTHIHLKSSQQLHTQFNQGLCLWKWAYVTSSVFCTFLSACLSLLLSISVSFCLVHHFPFCLSVSSDAVLLSHYIGLLLLLQIHLYEAIRGCYFFFVCFFFKGKSFWKISQWTNRGQLAKNLTKQAVARLYRLKKRVSQTNL